MNDTLLANWLRELKAQPDAPAVIDAASEKVWTRAMLDEAANRFQDTLPVDVSGQRVTFARPNGGDWFVVFLGLLKAGAVAVPLDPSEPVNAQRKLAEAARATWASIDGQFEAIGPRRRAGKKKYVLVKLTSGSTGAPQALAFTDAQMLADGRQVTSTMGITQSDVNFAVIPLGHSYGLGNLAIPLLAQGTACVCASAALPHALAKDLQRWQPTVFPAVPALLRALVASDVPAEMMSSVRTVISAGAVLSPEVAATFYQKFGRLVHGFYGATETGGITYDREGQASLEGRSVGTALEGVTITPTRGGRFKVQSAAVMGRGFFSPSDRAEQNASGELVLLSRAGRMMKIAGRRLDLGDLERAMSGMAGIDEAFAMPHPQHPEELAVALATKLSVAEVRTLLRRELAPWKIPKRLTLLREFPLTSRGKRDTRALTAMMTR